MAQQTSDNSSVDVDVSAAPQQLLGLSKRARSCVCCVCFLTPTLNQYGCKTFAPPLVAQRTVHVRGYQWGHPSTQLAISLYLWPGIWRIPVQVLSSLETGHGLLYQPLMVQCPNVCDGLSRKGWTWKARQCSLVMTSSCWMSCEWSLCQAQVERSHPGLYYCCYNCESQEEGWMQMTKRRGKQTCYRLVQASFPSCGKQNTGT